MRRESLYKARKLNPSNFLFIAFFFRFRLYCEKKLGLAGWIWNRRVHRDLSYVCSASFEMRCRWGESKDKAYIPFQSLELDYFTTWKFRYKNKQKIDNIMKTRFTRTTEAQFSKKNHINYKTRQRYRAFSIL